MVLEHEILPYFQWLWSGGAGSIGALPRFLLVALGLGLLGLMLGYVIAAARHGLLRGGDIVYRTITNGVRELFETSPRRVMALAGLAMKEAWRRRVVVALVVFFIILIFASWFLKKNHQDPAKLYISFVLTATTYLVLGIALLLSAFSLPNDFKTKTIYTIVTKPVRLGEIVLGRILGFTAVGTILLAIMGVCSYVFVNRSLDHTHGIDEVSLKNVTDADGANIGKDGRTTLENYHRHDVELDTNGDGFALGNFGHTHKIVQRGGKGMVLGADGIMRARVPQWGKLTFLDRQGVPKERGISVGSEWTYRSFVDGSTQATAIWTFDKISEALNSEEEGGLPIGLIVRVFRTHKGTIGKAITGSIQVRNPETGLTSDLIPFAALDAKIDERAIPRKLTGTDNSELDLYKDLVSSNGQLEIRVQCLERGQYFGFAQPDMYIRMRDASPMVNYVKVCLSIWVQMVIVIAIGVAASTLLSGPVAMLFTVSFIVLGFFRPFFVDVAQGPQYGGGPIESFYRLITQMNMISALEDSAVTRLIKGVDWVYESLMLSLAQVLPDFSKLSTVDFAAYGFNVPADLVFQNLTMCLAYVVGMSILGYFLFRTREVAR
ncbi:ABC transporter permease [Bythopirellula polymerisocia]|uniref:ABC-2 family transporter protein n=1 Tax=Bythopirellula polymerisocia TaxID=2528003 RepID=A0A5C6CN27_9BACT|nr:ABC transporter permease [Bythopirellula polymerisocia]TWU25828.1 ABC-2 family transporter protein [Bythopirellula polymerisocia]